MFQCFSSFPWSFDILILEYLVCPFCKGSTGQPGRIPFVLMNGPEGLIELDMELRTDISCVDI